MGFNENRSGSGIADFPVFRYAVRNFDKYAAFGGKYGFIAQFGIDLHQISRHIFGIACRAVNGKQFLCLLHNILCIILHQ